MNNKESWSPPLYGYLMPTSDPESFRDIPWQVTGIPLSGHPGSFGHVRKNHIHEGVDLYGKEGQTVFAVEDGHVVAIEKFTGDWSDPPSPWWNNTMALLVEGPSGVVVYGEISTKMRVGDYTPRGFEVGKLATVLKKDKGRPMTMLHLELHKPGTRHTSEWLDVKPESLLDPTPYLLRSMWRRDHVSSIEKFRETKVGI